MKRGLAIAAVAVYLCWFVASTVTRYYYTWHRPVAPAPTSGWTVAVTLYYGRVVYVTPAEGRLLYFASQWWALPLITAALFAGAYLNRTSRSGMHGAA